MNPKIKNRNGEASGLPYKGKVDRLPSEDDRSNISNGGSMNKIILDEKTKRRLRLEMKSKFKSRDLKTRERQRKHEKAYFVSH